MRVMQPAVLLGDYDWDERLVPRAEFATRLKDVWAALGGSGLAGLVVYGNKVDNSALAYLTYLTPKLDAAYALVAPDGSVRIHSSGSPQMMMNAQRLTWVEGVKPLRDAGRHIAEWAETLGPGPVGLWATEAMPAELPPRLGEALKGRGLREVGASLDPLLRHKSPVAMTLMRGACAALAAASAALRRDCGRGVSARDALIAAETAAFDAGAQDVRLLASLSPGGTPTALDYPQGERIDPLLAYIAVRHAGYWAEGMTTLASGSNATLAAAQAALQAMVAKAQDGALTADLAAAAREKLGGLLPHPAAHKLAIGIGLAPEETEGEPGGVKRLEAGRVYSLRAGALKAAGDAALVSAMVAPKTGATEILWSAIGPEA
jgi:Xaa-Pro aminopeptidase